MITSKLKVGILLSYVCMASVSAAIITPALPHIEQSYQLSQGSLEWIVSIFLIGYVIGQLIYGPVANRFGRLLALRAGLVINLAGIVICIIASQLHSVVKLILPRASYTLSEQPIKKIGPSSHNVSQALAIA
jgi:MFS family permease